VAARGTFVTAQAFLTQTSQRDSNARGAGGLHGPAPLFCHASIKQAPPPA
jgi:hypothetical protein